MTRPYRDLVLAQRRLSSTVIDLERHALRRRTKADPSRRYDESDMILDDLSDALSHPQARAMLRHRDASSRVTWGERIARWWRAWWAA